MGLKLKAPNGEWKKTGGSLKVLVCDEGKPNLIPQKIINTNGTYNANDDCVIITWDGNTEGLLSIPFEGDTYYRVDDRQFTYDEISEYEYYESDGTHWSSFDPIDPVPVYDMGYGIYSLKGVMVLTQPVDYGGVVIPVGVYIAIWNVGDGSGDYWASYLSLPNAKVKADGYAQIIAKVPACEVITTQERMDAQCVADNLGKIYKYDGGGDKYVNGDLYVVEHGYVGGGLYSFAQYRFIERFPVE